MNILENRIYVIEGNDGCYPLALANPTLMNDNLIRYKTVAIDKHTNRFTYFHGCNKYFYVDIGTKREQSVQVFDCKKHYDYIYKV